MLRRSTSHWHGRELSYAGDWMHCCHAAGGTSGMGEMLVQGTRRKDVQQEVEEREWDKRDSTPLTV